MVDFWLFGVLLKTGGDREEDFHSEGVKTITVSSEQKGQQNSAGNVPSVNRRVVFALFLIHFIGDFYLAFVNPLLPEFIEKFSLSLAQVGLITGLSRLLAFMVQPSIGYLADHYRTRFFVLGGPLLVMVFISLVGIAPTFPILLTLIVLGSIGSAMYHPTAAGMVSTYSGPHIGLSMSVFNMGGTMAFGLGPLLITYLVSRFGLSASPFALLIGLVAMVYPFKMLPCPEEEGLKDLGFMGSMKEVLGKVWKPIALIWVISALRSFVSQTFSTFLPVLCAREGLSLVSIGVIVSLYSIAGAVSGLIAGHLSDRIGYKPIFYTSSLLATVFLCLLLALPGRWVLVNAFFSGFFIMAVLPLTVTMGQELAPKGKSIVSSLMMGLAFGMGGMMTPLAGHFADLYSIRSVLAIVALSPVLTIPLIHFLPEKKKIITRTVCAR
jgi:FSR family fosmidomycin resistance protein-like MFS transporter